MKKKIFVLLTAAVMVMTMLTACSGGGNDGGGDAELKDWEYIQDKGKLIVGLDDTFAPMGFRDENDNLVGFDIDLANAVGEKLGIEVVFQPIDWTAKEAELESGNIDCIWNGMSATPERQESMSLSNKYLNNKIVLMSYDEAKNVKDVAELADLKIAVQGDSAALETLQANEAWDTFKDNVMEYPTYDEALLDMQSGRIDVVAIDEIFGNYKSSNSEDKLFTSELNMGDDFYAIGFRKADTETTAKVNEAIQACIDEGIAEKISKKWFGKMLVINEGY